MVNRQPAASGSLNRITARLILAGASVALALVLAEVVLRLIGFSAPNLYEPHPQLGWILRPGARGWYTAEGRGFVQVNSVGMRDREHSLRKPDGVYRIAVLGDSYTEAKQVPVDSTFWSLLPDRLTDCGFQPGKEIETLNFSASGYGTAQELILLRLLAEQYHPDLVLLQINGGNDIRNNSKALEWDNDRPFYQLNPDGTLSLDSSFMLAPRYRLMTTPTRRFFRVLASHSRVAQLIHAVRQENPKDRKERHFAIAEAGLDEWELSPPRDSLQENAWRVTEALIAEVNREAAANGTATLVMTVPWPPQIQPDLKSREAFAKQVGIPDFGYPDRRIQAFGKAHNIPVLTLAPSMGAVALETKTYFNGFGDHLGFGHWNSAGHRVAAEVIAEAMCSSPLIPKGNLAEAVDQPASPGPTN
jgi:hypothetical protein